jgi:Zn-dependent protease
MIKPAIVRPEDEVRQLGQAFGAPLIAKGWTWLPLAQIAAWGVMARLAGKRCPERSLLQRWLVGLLTMPVVLGSEWCHNLAHTAAAQYTGKPVDCIRVNFGMPLLVYYDINDPTVTPRQHITRALGGPVFNLLVLPFAWLLKRFSRPESVWRDVGNTAYATNLFLATVSLLPIPGIDGGPILKWSLVERGKTVEQADEAVKKVNLGLGAGLMGGAAGAAKKRKWWLAGFSAMLGFTALAVGLGWFKEQ